ncbi:hypothetical protein B6V75_03205 [Thioclava sp. F1Mire-8]|nr:hypothetical protein B6V75_03205 [Thioclava sp. F1Mire-8]
MAQLTRPATREWIVGRMAALLIHYYTAELPEQVNRAIGNDWAHELKGKPAWAISNACRWWMSPSESARIAGRPDLTLEAWERRQQLEAALANASTEEIMLARARVRAEHQREAS